MFLFTICLFFLCVRTPCWQSVARHVNSSYKMLKRVTDVPRGLCATSGLYAQPVISLVLKERTKES